MRFGNENRYSEEQWIVVGECPDCKALVYGNGDETISPDCICPALEAYDSLIGQINLSTAKIEEIKEKMAHQSIDRFIKDAYGKVQKERI